jgi:hypothetical protein
MLTTATVRELKPREKMYEVTCAAMPGFVVRVLPTGKKVFLVRHQVDGQWRREKIGVLGPSLGVDEARRRAVLMLGAGERDEPTVQPAAGRSAPRSTRRVEPVKQVESRRLTVRELADRFVREFVDVYLKPGTAINYRRHLADHILPVLGDRDFESVTRSDAQTLHASLKHTPGLGQLRALRARQPLQAHHRRLGAVGHAQPRPRGPPLQDEDPRALPDARGAAPRGGGPAARPADPAGPQGAPRSDGCVGPAAPVAHGPAARRDPRPHLAHGRLAAPLPEPPRHEDGPAQRPGPPT